MHVRLHNMSSEYSKKYGIFIGMHDIVHEIYNRTSDYEIEEIVKCIAERKLKKYEVKNNA